MSKYGILRILYIQTILYTYWNFLTYFIFGIVLPWQEDTCRFLDWFKNLEESHRSLHMASFSQTEAINRNGRFLVGNLTKELNKNNSVCIFLPIMIFLVIPTFWLRRKLHEILNIHRRSCVLCQRTCFPPEILIF